MSTPNSFDFETALIGLLAADTTLKSILPDGVFYDVAPQGAKRFTIVSLFDSQDRGVFNGRAFESNIYLVKGVGLSSVFTLTNLKAAADRIDDLLQDATIAIAGFVFMDMSRIDDARQSRHRQSRPDAVDAALLWHEGGGFYRVRASWPNA